MSVHTLLKLSSINRISLKNVANEIFPQDGLNIRLNDTPQEKEHRLHYYKIKF